MQNDLGVIISSDTLQEMEAGWAELPKSDIVQQG